MIEIHDSSSPTQVTRMRSFFFFLLLSILGIIRNQLAETSAVRDDCAYFQKVSPEFDENGGQSIGGESRPPALYDQRV